MKICAALIFNNRKEEEAALLKALSHQTLKNFEIRIYHSANNKIEKEIIPENLAVNHIVTNYKDKNELYRFVFTDLIDSDYDWLWMVHDDAIPQKDALFNLVGALDKVKNASFICSSIYDNANKPINVPLLSPFKVEGEAAWAEKLEYSLVRVAHASFVSVLINMQAVKFCGVPSATHHFQKNSNYLSLLVNQYGAGYISGKSIVIHKHKNKYPDTKKIKICAIVVTYNRKDVLVSCLKALKNQKYKDFDILIVDNASTDGTFEEIRCFLSDEIKYINTGANLGGAGGFYFGMKHAYSNGYDWLWIMDDDVIPMTNALAELVEHLKYVKKVSFLASAVYSKNGDAMNTPEISKYSTNGYRFWYDKLEYGMVRLMHATFVSLLINCDAIQKCGLPCKDYFIWGDDTEYTMRIIGKYGAAYIVGSSKVTHMRTLTSNLSIFKENNISRIKMYYYLVRNTLLNTKTYFGENAYKNFLKKYNNDCKIIKKSNDKNAAIKVKTIKKAINDFKKNNYNIAAFNNRYDVYGQEKGIFSFIGAEKLQEMGVFTNYQLNHLCERISMFALLDGIPAFIKEKFDIQTNSLNILSETLRKDEYIIVDFSYSCTKLIEYYNSTSSFRIDKSIDILNYEKREFDPHDLDDNTIYKKVIEFAIILSKYYQAKNIILFEDKDNTDQLLNKINDYFAKVVPQCSVLSYNHNIESSQILQRIEKIIEA